MTGNLYDDRYPGFCAMVQTAAMDSTLGNERFPARNFILDEGVHSDRAVAYLDRITPNIATGKTFAGLHSDYVAERILKIRGHARHGLDPTSEPAETFSLTPNFRFGNVAQTLTLVRCESLTTIIGVAKRSGLGFVPDEQTFSDMVMEWLSAPKTHLRSGIQDILDCYADSADGRPIFAAFEDDLRDGLTDPDMWQDSIRNALGLAHIRKGQTVLLLQYAVARIPKVPNSPGVRALAAPTVLDSTMSSAFCPSPGTQQTGHTVHLNPTSFTPCREVLHPWIRWQTTDIVRMGTVKTAPENDLQPSRAFHLLGLRDLAARPDYAAETDSDILD